MSTVVAPNSETRSWTRSPHLQRRRPHCRRTKLTTTRILGRQQGTRRGARARLQNTEEEEATEHRVSPTPSGRRCTASSFSLAPARWRWKLLTGQVHRRGAAARGTGRRRPARRALVLGRAQLCPSRRLVSLWDHSAQRGRWGNCWAVFYCTAWVVDVLALLSLTSVVVSLWCNPKTSARSLLFRRSKLKSTWVSASADGDARRSARW